MLDALLGPLGGILAAIVTAAAAWALGRYTGGRDARTKRDAQDGRDYIKERTRQDEIDVGHGATDGERVKRLHEIANRNRTGKN